MFSKRYREKLFYFIDQDLEYEKIRGYIFASHYNNYQQ